MVIEKLQNSGAEFTTMTVSHFNNKGVFQHSYLSTSPNTDFKSFLS